MLGHRLRCWPNNIKTNIGSTCLVSWIIHVGGVHMTPAIEYCMGTWDTYVFTVHLSTVNTRSMEA